MVKFEKVSRIKEEIPIPVRATSGSAGYDFFAIEDVAIPAKQTVRIMTGIKCELMPNMALILANRSSNPSKKHLVLMNGIGIVDSDYYNNIGNEGEIGFEFYNISDEDIEIKKGEKLGQGLVIRFIIADNEIFPNPDIVRSGGYGSTGK